VTVWAMFVAFLGNRNSQVENRAVTIVVNHRVSRFYADALCMGKPIFRQDKPFLNKPKMNRRATSEQ
jgi:hypothetical protein